MKRLVTMSVIDGSLSLAAGVMTSGAGGED